VAAREEERKRLRRDLHDGVGPSLAAIVLKLDAAQTREDEADRNALLVETREEARQTIKEVRRLVDDLRPPAIDEVGLVDAIRQRAATLSTDALTYDVTGPETLPFLPAAVEVAAFRIASEAMTNTAKHSGASRCTVAIELDGTLGVTVTDNGRTCVGAPRPGVGWTSMTERAAELGGSCTISSRAEGGLVVRAVLPLAATIDQTADVETAT
jgi:signal transduction histidine kinase